MVQWAAARAAIRIVAMRMRGGLSLIVGRSVDLPNVSLLTHGSLTTLFASRCCMTLIKFIEIMAILVGAFSGFIEARRKRMDLVGVFTVAFITAFGGGTLRDILLDKRPLFWVTHQEYAIAIFVLALVA